MKNLTVIGLDLAKNVFQVHGMDDRGHKVCGARLKRSEVLSYFANLPPVLVGMEACGGAHTVDEHADRGGRRRICACSLRSETL